ncbi:hypothetical protein J4210_02940 [Candidatus Woesearchaeota archaeon]|nr:hypothetical protein [Candidatus Woesearchaeota archaeon]
MKLFKEEVYERLQQASNVDRGIEEALSQIVGDSDLQTAIRNYALRNEITQKGFGEYGTGVREYCGANNTFRDRRIIFWSRESPVMVRKQADPVRKDELYIGPDPEAKVMPIYLRFRTLNDEPEPWAPEFVYTNLEIEQKEPGKFYLQKIPDKWSIAMQRRLEIAGRRMIDVPFLHEKSASEFLDGLEKSLSEILQG